MKDTIHIDKIEEYVYKCICSNELSEGSLVQLFERLNTFTNLKTITQYAKDNNISYNGAKNNRKVIELFGVKFIADNE